VQVQKRGLAFFGVVRELHKAGYDLEAVLATLLAHPRGVHSKYGARLETELRRVWDKLGGNADQVAFQEPQWPDPLGLDATSGLAGEFLALVMPHTEADKAALLFQFLAAFGNVIGLGPHYLIESDRHPARLNVVLVGITAKGRKGTSVGRVRALFGLVDPIWESTCIASGLASGEGLIFAVRDPTIDKDGTETDPGAADKRLLALSSEFAGLLRIMSRPGNSLSPVIRDAWDRDSLRSLTKNSPLRASGVHISQIGHATTEELRQYLDRTECANGYANRHLFVCVRRSRLLPDGGGQINWQPLADRLRNTVTWARAVGLVTMTDDASVLWHHVYPALSAERFGLFGAIVARAEAQVIRLALIYALLDRSERIGAVHLRAALECWRYAEDSARYVFGESLGDPTADTILDALRQEPDGLTRTQISDLFNRNLPARELDRGLLVLHRAGLATRHELPTPHRSTTVWKATRHARV
jgi:hypothetical protein